MGREFNSLGQKRLFYKYSFYFRSFYILGLEDTFLVASLGSSVDSEKAKGNPLRRESIDTESELRRWGPFLTRKSPSFQSPTYRLSPISTITLIDHFIFYVTGG